MRFGVSAFAASSSSTSSQRRRCRSSGVAPSFGEWLLRWWLEWERTTAGPGTRPGIDALLQYATVIRGHGDPRKLEEDLRALGPVQKEKVMAHVGGLIGYGIEQGIARGVAEGERTVLLRQLRLKFGELDAATTSRVQAATIEELEGYAERILTATSVADVLGG